MRFKLEFSFGKKKSGSELGSAIATAVLNQMEIEKRPGGLLSENPTSLAHELNQKQLSVPSLWTDQLEILNLSIALESLISSLREIADLLKKKGQQVGPDAQ